MTMPPVQIMLMGKRYMASIEDVKALQDDLAIFGNMFFRCKSEGIIERIAPADMPDRPWADK